MFSPEVMSESTMFYPELYDSQFKGELKAFEVVTDEITAQGSCHES